jgi:anti-sigma28 factor (negative regulator of flagellin synthesis)
MSEPEKSRNNLAALGEQLRKQTEGTAEREALLRRLAADIEAGRYEVDAHTLAQKLIDEALKTETKPAAPAPPHRRQP